MEVYRPKITFIFVLSKDTCGSKYIAIRDSDYLSVWR